MLTYRLTRHYRGFGVDRDEQHQSEPTHRPVTTAERDAPEESSRTMVRRRRRVADLRFLW